MRDIIELLKDSADVGHQITYTEIDGEAEPDCDSDCTGCRAHEMHEVLKDMPKVVCLCGSTRFGQAFQEANLRETLIGNIVLSIGCNMRSDTELFHAMPEDKRVEVKTMLDALHKRKIDLADEVLILNVGGYIGESTLAELKHAIKRDKAIRFLEPDNVPLIPELLHYAAKRALRKAGAEIQKLEQARKVDPKSLHEPMTI